MRNFLLLAPIITGLFFSVISAAQQTGTFYVAAKSGLSIRETPDAGAKVLDKIPYGTRVSLLEYGEEKKSIVTEGILGYWQKVKYNNKTGYVVDSYLFPLPAPVLSSVKEMKQYLAQTTQPFGAKLTVKSGAMNNVEEGGWQMQKQLYKNGAEWHHFMGYEYGSDTYFLPDFSIQQAFLLVRLIPEFKEVFGEKEEFPLENKTYKKGDREYKITVDKEVYGDYPWIKKISLEYEDGAIYSFEIYQADGQVVIFFGAGV